MQHSRRTLAWIALSLAGCSGQTTDDIDVEDLDASNNQVQNDGSVVDASVTDEDAALDASMSQPSDAAPVLDATTGDDASLADAASTDAGDDDVLCGPKLTCGDIDFSASRVNNFQAKLQIPDGFPFKSGIVSGMVDDLQCSEPQSFSAALNFDSESDQLLFAAHQFCPFRACGALTLTITDDCERTYDLPISVLILDNCEGTDLTPQGSCGTDGS
jgi:hypothetical protein